MEYWKENFSKKCAVNMIIYFKIGMNDELEEEIERKQAERYSIIQEFLWLKKISKEICF